MTLCRDGDLSIRLLREHDLPTLLEWFSDDRVLEWYGGRDQQYDLDDIRHEYSPAALAAEGVHGCIVHDGGEAIGFVQCYEVDRAATPAAYLLRPDDAHDVWGVDIVIATPERWGSGIGTRVMQLLVHHLFVDRHARRVVIDPRVVNTRAIASYRKVGFREVGVLPEQEVHEGVAWDSQIMWLDALDHPVGLAAHLARIDSVNPALVPGAAGEAAVADAVAAWATQRGFDVHRAEPAPGRHNVVVVRRGSGGGRSLLFNGHLDTVGPTVTGVVLGDGRIEGRGVLDTKGGLAAAMLAAAAIAPGELAGDVIVAAVADEEHGSLGTEALVAEWRADGAVVIEPTDLHVVTRHRGFAVVEVTIEGRAAHTSRPERGVNAVHAAALVVRAVAEIDRAWDEGADDPGDRPAALVSGIRSAGETFTVPPRCDLVVEVRTTAADPEGQVGEVVRAVMEAADGVGLDVRATMSRPPLGVPAHHPFVRAVGTAVGGATHVEAVLASAPYWTDAALHHGASTAAVVLGPVGQGLHEDLEWVTTDSLHRLTAAFTALARDWCA
jgi:acetylornithine deacetylase